jgi:hypothetical protein
MLPTASFFGEFAKLKEGKDPSLDATVDDEKRTVDSVVRKKRARKKDPEQAL